MRAALVVATLAWVARAHAGGGVPFPDGVADERGERAFIATAGGAEAIALASGATKWRASTAGHPLALVDGRLLTWLAGARRDELRFALVDSERGRVVQMSPAVALAPWVAVAPLFAHSFECRATVEGGHVHVSWRATAAWSQGMHPRDEQEAAARHQSGGTIELDVAAGHLAIGASTVASPPTPLPPAGTTLDGRHHLERDGGAWALVSLSDGRRIAPLPLGEGFHDVTVIGARLYLVREPHGLEAIALPTGRVLWQHALPRSPPRPMPQ